MKKLWLGVSLISLVSVLSAQKLKFSYKGDVLLSEVRFRDANENVYVVPFEGKMKIKVPANAEEFCVVSRPFYRSSTTRRHNQAISSEWVPLFDTENKRFKLTLHGQRNAADKAYFEIDEN